jgi:hypothetical protein
MISRASAVGLGRKRDQLVVNLLGEFPVSELLDGGARIAAKAVRFLRLAGLESGKRLGRHAAIVRHDATELAPPSPTSGVRICSWSLPEIDAETDNGWCVMDAFCCSVRPAPSCRGWSWSSIPPIGFAKRDHLRRGEPETLGRFAQAIPFSHYPRGRSLPPYRDDR